MWQSEVVPQLVADTDGRLQVLTLFKALCRRHPGRFQGLGAAVRIEDFEDFGRRPTDFASECVQESRGRSLRRVSLWVSIRAGGRDRNPERPEVIRVHLAGTHSGMQGGDRSAPGRVQALVLRLSCTAAWRIVATAYRTRPSSEAVESVEWGERKRIC